MSRRLFGTNPDVKILENEGKNNSIKGHGKSIFIKKISMILMRACFNLRGRGWLVLSAFEMQEIRLLFPNAPEVPFLRVPWALADDEFKIGDRNYFSKFSEAAGKLKIVVWARLDFELKGIDRLLAGMAIDTSDSDINYHVFLIGPDYAGGQAKLRNRLRELELEERVTIVGPEGYTSGDHSPLAMADASVLLSRWDGFPRALRESLQLGVPVLISPETHFEDLVAQFPCGECANIPDDPSSVNDAIHRLIEGIGKGKYSPQSFNSARASLAAEALAISMEDYFSKIL